MYNFIKNIMDFIGQIFDYIRNYSNNYLGVNLWSDFIAKNIFTENSLIGLNMTYQELFRLVIPITLIFIFIVLFVKFVFKILGLFRFNRLND